MRYSYGGAIGWDGFGPLALGQTGDVVFGQIGDVAIEPTGDVVFGQTGRLDILGSSANGAA
ncbi:MAG: hypothetical protein WCR20_17260 [Verrucomicrobiota bacterium]